MPIAIVISAHGAIPAVIEEKTEKGLLKRLADLTEAPALTDADSAREWLQTLPMPSGWFATQAEAMAHVERMQQPTPILPGATVKAAREALQMSRASFAAKLGIGGNDNTRHKAIFEIENESLNKSSGRPRVLNPDATRRLQALLAQHRLAGLMENE